MKTKLKPKHKIIITSAIIAAVLGVGYGVQKYKSVQEVKKLHQLVSSNFHVDQQTKNTDCRSHNAMPDHACTPGAIFPSAMKAQVCTSGYSSTVRNVSTNDKDRVYAEYGIATHNAGQYEVDHFISLELGGSNDIANLWPELASPIPGFHEKDKVENYLHTKLCNGQISLQESQELISAKWLEVYTLIYK